MTGYTQYTSIPYPTRGEAPNGPAQLRALAEAIDPLFSDLAQQITDLQAELASSLPVRYSQGADQPVSSSTTVVGSSIVIPITDPVVIRLDARYTSLGGGMRWAWATTSGTVTCYSRLIHSAGQTPGSGNAAEIPEMRLRMIATPSEVQTTAHFTTNTSMAIQETLVCAGAPEGTLTFRFAQESSSSSATTLDDTSYALVQRINL